MTEKDKTLPQIMNQFRGKGGMVYELRCNEIRLVVTISPRKTVDDAGDWHVDARPARAPEDTMVFDAWGATRMDALRAVGKSWAENPPGGQPSFDWEVVAKALADVRAV